MDQPQLRSEVIEEQQPDQHAPGSGGEARGEPVQQQR